MRLLHEIAIFQTVKSKVIISLVETVRLSVSISLRNLYNSLNSIKECFFSSNSNPMFGIVLNQIFSFQNNPKNLERSCKMDLDFLGCFGKKKSILQQNYTRLVYICTCMS